MKMKPEIEEQVLKLYGEGKYPLEIQKELGMKNFQPIFNLLHKRGVYEKRPTRYHRKYFFQENFFEKIDSEEKAYIFGFITADGHVDVKWKRCIIQLHSQDRDILEKIATAVGSDPAVIKNVTHDGRPHSKLDLNSKKLMNDLLALGLTGNKSLTMTGDIVDNVPVELMRHFLRGYFDGDGHVTLGARYSSGVKYIIDIIGTKSFLEASYGKYCSTKCKLAKYSSCDMWHWRTASKKSVLEFLSYIYDDSNIYMNRKRDYFLNFLKTECAHVKPEELLETQTSNVVGNQQPSP